ncbi:MAG TPA: dihydrofolate reductase [Bacilli bacterium]|nr:dihydrofolate reductase [Bacilli bacterium]
MISIIVAIGRNNLIGKGNDLPWYYPLDLKYFKEKTLNKTVLMGENTFYSIVDRLNKPLPKRKSIVATLNPEFSYPGVEVVNDLIGFLQQEHQEEIFVIGGKQIYNLALPYADRLYITHIDKDYAGDVYLPAIDYSKYQIISENIVGDLKFCIYKKVK